MVLFFFEKSLPWSVSGYPRVKHDWRGHLHGESTVGIVLNDMS